MNRSLRGLGVKQIYNIPPLDEASSIQRRIAELYTTIIGEYSLGDIRFMIGQELGVDYLLDIALNHLEENILLETEYYEGDLLSIILHLLPDFWETHPTEKTKLLELLKANYDIILGQDFTIESNRKIKKLLKNSSKNMQDHRKRGFQY